MFVSGSRPANNKVFEWNGNALIPHPDLLTARDGHCMVSAKDYLWAIGGWNVKTCEYYKIDSANWVEGPALNKGRSVFSSVTISDKYIYVIGG